MANAIEKTAVTILLVALRWMFSGLTFAALLQFLFLWVVAVSHINLSVGLEVFGQSLRSLVRCCHLALQAPFGGRWILVAVEARVASLLAAIAKALGYILVISFSSNIPRLADATNSANFF
jgi:hypothetical protein